jgi:hypothetical protein
VSRAFGTTPHSEIAQAFERENRTHTYVEQLTTCEHVKRYELRASLEELLTLLDSLSHAGKNTFEAVPEKSSWTPRLAPRLLRAKILATLGLFEEG